MRWTTAAVVVGAMGLAMAGATVPANAAPNADDHECLVAPYLSQCIGAPLGVPTSPSDPSCAMSPADAVCAGGPFSGGAAGPPPIGSGLPGSIDSDGMPYGSPPAPPVIPSIPSTPGMGGMPGMGI